jgi:hypothetical protein
MVVALYHTTDQAEAILRGGFRDGEGSYLFVGITLKGVFLSDSPVDVNEGAKGDRVLEVVLRSSRMVMPCGSGVFPPRSSTNGPRSGCSRRAR